MRTLPNQTDRHRAAIVRAARIGGSLARLIRAALSSCVDALPENPGPVDLVRLRAHVEAVVFALGPIVAGRLYALLLRAARREHFITAVALTRATRPVREDVTDYLRLIVPAPALDLLRRIVGPTWQKLTRLISPQKASNVVLQGVASGKSRKEIAADLTDVFGGFESVARRVARTEGLRVATQTQLEVSEAIPDLVIGYELNTVLDDRVRPEHRRRHGWRYYREPVGNQRPLSDCPQPPIWNNELAHNCRCFLVPLIRGDDG